MTNPAAGTAAHASSFPCISGVAGGSGPIQTGGLEWVGDPGYPLAWPEGFADAVGAVRGSVPVGAHLAWGLAGRDAFNPG